VNILFEFGWKTILICSQVLEYTGKGKSIIDVGLAQAKAPLNTTNHYFEIEILDPGENCYIAIGLTNRVRKIKTIQSIIIIIINKLYEFKKSIAYIGSILYR
jgi:hypothetical protein